MISDPPHSPRASPKQRIPRQGLIQHLQFCPSSAPAHAVSQRVMNGCPISPGCNVVNAMLVPYRIEPLRVEKHTARSTWPYPVVIGEDRLFSPQRGASGVRRAPESGREFRDRPGVGRDSELPLSRPPPHVRLVVHDEQRRPLRTREDPRPTRTSRRLSAMPGSQSGTSPGPETPLVRCGS